MERSLDNEPVELDQEKWHEKWENIEKEEWARFNNTLAAHRFSESKKEAITKSLVKSLKECTHHAVPDKNQLYIQQAIEFAEAKRFNGKVMKLSKNHAHALDEMARMATGKHPRVTARFLEPIGVKNMGSKFSEEKMTRFGKDLVMHFCLSITGGISDEDGDDFDQLLDRINKPYMAIVVLSCTGFGEIHSKKKSSFKTKLLEVLGGRQWVDIFTGEEDRYITLKAECLDDEWKGRGSKIVKCCCHEEDYHAPPVAIMIKTKIFREFACNNCDTMDAKLNHCLCNNAWYCGKECQRANWEKHRSKCVPVNRVPVCPKPKKLCGHCSSPGATHKCSKCQSVSYCNRNCQLVDWPKHKKTCVKT